VAGGSGGEDGGLAVGVVSGELPTWITGACVSCIIF